MFDSITMKSSVLIIEDRVNQHHKLQAGLEEEGFQVFIAENGLVGLDIWSRTPGIRMVVTDLEVSEVDGFEVIKTIRENEDLYTYIIVLVMADEKELLEKSLIYGADDFAYKPILLEEVVLRLQGAMRFLRLEDQHNLIGALAELAATRSGETGAHLQRTREYTHILAHDLVRHHPELGLSEQVADDISTLSVLHDIGKNSLPDGLLNKRGRYTPREYEMMKDHTTIGGAVLKKLHQQTGSLCFLLGHDIAIAHHEKFDGSGYPFGLQGNDIPLGGRVVALADAYDALLSTSSYKDAFSFEHTQREILAEKGKHFDPMLVESFERNQDAFEKVHRSVPGDKDGW